MKNFNPVKFYILCVLFPSVLLNVEAFSTTVLYDIDFSSPPHVLDSQMITGYGPIPRNTPTRSNSGEQIVVSSLGSLTDQPVHLIPGKISIPDRCYSQFNLDLREFDYPMYRLDFDLCIERMSWARWDEFVLFFDVPTVVRLEFSHNGKIFENEMRHTNIIREYDFGEKLSMSILVDLPENTWSINCNSEHLYTGQFFYPYPAHPEPPAYIRSIRFHLADDNGDRRISSAAIDNIKVWGIPEPATVLLLGLGGLALLRRRKHG